jgi:hypothetical protein
VVKCKVLCSHCFFPVFLHFLAIYENHEFRVILTLWAFHVVRHCNQNCRMWQAREENERQNQRMLDDSRRLREEREHARIQAEEAERGTKEPSRRCGRPVSATDQRARFQHYERCHPDYLDDDFTASYLPLVRGGNKRRGHSQRQHTWRVPGAHPLGRGPGDPGPWRDPETFKNWSNFGTYHKTRKIGDIVNWLVVWNIFYFP